MRSYRQPSRCRFGWARPNTGFTLVEIMIVVAIIGIFAAAGLPSIIRAISPNPLKKAINDIVEGCSHARAQAILQGRPMEFVITAGDGGLTVRPAPSAANQNQENQPIEIVFGAGDPPPQATATANFSAHLNQDVAVQLLDVNFVDHMQAEDARVHFYPNGTCDDFTIVLAWEGGITKISTEVVTSLTEIQKLR